MTRSSNITKPKRSYADATLKILFTLSGNECAHPDCDQSVIQDSTTLSPDKVVGQICHVYASSDAGPRGNPKLTDKERNAPENLLIFCPTHHVIVDGQHETYPATLLIEWKKKHERKYRSQMSSKINDLGYAELELAAQALASGTHTAVGDLSNIPIQDKIVKNRLGSAVAWLLTLGSSKSAETARMLEKAAQLDAGFPERLKSGFVVKYLELNTQGLSGDEVFFALYDWAAGMKYTEMRKLAGLCILAHLFIMCDIFEKYHGHRALKICHNAVFDAGEQRVRV